MSPKRSTKRRSSKRSSSNSPRKTSWTRKLMAWRKANRHADGSLPSMKIAMKACKGRSQKRSKCRKSAGRKPKSGKRKSSKRRSSKRKSSKRRSTKRRSSKRRSNKRRSSKRRSSKRRSSKRRSTKRRSSKRRSSKRRSSKRRSSKKTSKRRSSLTRKLRKYYPSSVGKRFQKFERPSSMPRYAATSSASSVSAASTNDAPYTGSRLLLTGPSAQRAQASQRAQRAQRIQRIQVPQSAQRIQVPQRAQANQSSESTMPTLQQDDDLLRSRKIYIQPYEQHNDKGKRRATDSQLLEQSSNLHKSNNNNINALAALMNGDVDGYKQAISDFGPLTLNTNDEEHIMLVNMVSSALVYYNVNDFDIELLNVLKNIAMSDLWNEYFNNREQRLLMLKNSVDTITGNEELTKWYINNLDYTEEEKQIAYTYPGVIANPKIKSIIENKSVFSTLVGGFF